MYDIKWFKKMISCPVPSISTPFKRNGDLDFDGISNQIEMSIEAGSNSILLTWGDSLFSILKDEEILSINKFVIEQARKRIMVIASGNCWPTVVAAEFAGMAKEWGADIVIALTPNWAISANAETLYQHYKAIGQVMPSMAMTSMLGTSLPLKTVEMLLDDPESGLVAVKDDVCGEYGRRLGTLLNGRCAFLSGGCKYNYIDQVLYGADGYLSCFNRFRPDISKKFWELRQQGEIEKCMEIVKKIEIPFIFDLPEQLGLDFDCIIHTAMEIFGVCERWRRNPYQNATDEQMEKIKGFLSKI